MFDTKDLDAISQEYFNIICTSEYDVTVQSKNTGHLMMILLVSLTHICQDISRVLAKYLQKTILIVRLEN